MAITAGKLMLTMMHPEMLFVPHVHQPIVASPAVRVDDSVQGYLAPDRSLSLLFEGIWDDLGVDFSLPFQDPEDNCFTACSTTLLPTDTARTKTGFIDFNLAREGR